MSWFNSTLRRSLFAFSALLFGLGVGFLFSTYVAPGLPRETVQFSAIALDCFIQVCAAASAVIIVRKAEPSKLWGAATTMALPVFGAEYVRDLYPLLILPIEASWLLTVLACGSEKRNLGTLCIICCAVCTTAVKVSSRMDTYNYARAVDYARDYGRTVDLR